MLFFIGIGAAILAINAASEGHFEFAGWTLALAAASVLPVLIQWLRYRGVGVYDFIQGGVMWVRKNPAGVHWGDWSLLFTRFGSIDIKANFYEVRYRFFYGLIPYRTLEGRLKDLGSVRLSETTGGDSNVTTWTVHLEVEGKEESIFDAAGRDRNRGADLAEELEGAVREALAGASEP